MLKKENTWLFYVRPKKKVKFPEIGRVKIFYHSPAGIAKCVSEYIFLIFIKKKKRKKKTVSVENLTGYDDIVSAYFLTFLIESWICPSCSCEINIVHVWQEKSLYLLTSTIYYAMLYYNNTLYRIKIKEKHWEKFLLLIFSLISVYSWLEICYNSNTYLRHSTWWERDELIYHSKYIIGTGRKQPPVFYNKNCSWKFRSLHRKIPILESIFNKEL